MDHSGAFFLLSFLIVICSLGTVLSSHFKRAAIFLVIDLVLIAMLYASLNAVFLAIVQLFVYALGVGIILLVLEANLSSQGMFAPRKQLRTIDKLGISISVGGIAGICWKVFNGTQKSLVAGGHTNAELDELGNLVSQSGSFVWMFLLVVAALLSVAVILRKTEKMQQKGRK